MRSSIIKLVRKPGTRRPLEARRRFYRITKTVFAQRRKRVVKRLQRMCPDGAPDPSAILAGLGGRLDARAGDLDPETWWELVMRTGAGDACMLPMAGSGS